MITPNDSTSFPIAMLDEVKKESGKVGASPHELTQPEVDGLKSRHMRPVIFGNFRYRDVFGFPHQFRFCRIMVPEGEAVSIEEYDTARKCLQYNYTDNN